MTEHTPSRLLSAFLVNKHRKHVKINNNKWMWALFSTYEPQFEVSFPRKIDIKNLSIYLKKNFDVLEEVFKNILTNF